MRFTTSNFDQAAARTDGAGFRYLLVVSVPGTVRYLSTDERTVGGDQYAGELLSVGDIYAAANQLSDVTIELLDNAANRAVVRLTAHVVLGLMPLDYPSWTDTAVLLHGEISDPIDISGGKIKFDVVSYASRHDRGIGTPITLDDYPAAYPDAVGLTKPILYGRHKEHLCPAIDVGVYAVTNGSMTVGSSLVPLGDTSMFLASGSVIIGQEQIDYASKTSIWLTGLTRGANGTTVASHPKGWPVVEVGSQYDYLVADHPVKSISNLKINGDPPITNYTFLTNDNGQAKIRFNAPPALDKTVYIEVSENIGVDSVTTATRTEVLATTTALSQYVNVWDANGGRTHFSFASPSGSIVNASITTQIDVYSDWGNTPWWGSGDQYVRLYCQGRNASGGLVGTKQLLYEVYQTGSVTVPSQLPQLATYTAILTGDVHSIRMWWERSSGGANVFGGVVQGVTINRTISATVQNTRTGGIDASTNSATDIVIGGDVTCDVDSYEDDASGTFTGTPNALLERPDHIARHLLQQYGKATATHTAAADFDPFTGQTLAFKITTPQRVLALLKDIGDQVGGLAHYGANQITGGWRFIKRPGVDPTADITLTDINIIRRDNGAPSLQESRIGLRQLHNRHVWRAGLQPSGGWLSSGIKDDSASQADYGLRDVNVDLPFIHDEAQAQAHIDWRSLREADPERPVIVADATLAALKAEPGDVVALSSIHADVHIAGEVMATRYSHGGRVQLTVEVLGPVRLAVVWTDLVGVIVDGDGLLNTGTNGWNGGAASVQMIVGDGGVEYTAIPIVGAVFFGLSNSNASSSFATINYAIRVDTFGNLAVYENGMTVYIGGTHLEGDVLRVERVGSTVEYTKNGVSFKTSDNPSSGDLLVDVTLELQGTRFDGAVIVL